MDLTDLIRKIRFAGLGTSLRTLRYSLYRDWLNRGYHPENPSLPLKLPGKLKAVQATTGGRRFLFKNCELEIRYLAPGLARLSWTPGVEPVPYALQATEWAPLEVVSTGNEGDGIRLIPSGEGEKLEIAVNADGSLAFFDCLGQMRRWDPAPERQGNAWRHKSHLPPEACIFGAGEQSTQFERSGADFTLWNRDPGGSYGPGDGPLYAPLPVYLALETQGAQLTFYENSFPARLAFAGQPAETPPVWADLQPKVEAWFEDGMLRYYVCLGTPEEVLKSYTQLTGRAPLPPRWALGYHQCRWGYRTEADIRRVAQGFQEHDLPISAIHLDIDYMDGFRVFTVNQERFPDLAGLARDLASQGIRLVTILDPGVKRDPGYFLYREGLRRKVFCKTFFGRPLIGLVWPDWSAFPDFTNPEARKWWGEQYPRLLDQGVAGFWHDMNEPTSFAAWGDTTLPLPTRHSLEGRGGDHRQAHNLYALQMNRAGFEALRRQRPDRRPWILSRAGWAGQQRYAWNWTGDIETSWESLRMTLPTVLGLGLSGLPFSGPDVGGFSGDPSAELYLRWFQMACFFPFFRTHSALGTAPREPWVFGEETTRRVREALRLRYSLIPYLYTLAWEASQTGCPPVRPLFWADPGDRRLWQVEDAFLFGSALLVAPILEEGAQDRQVSLPGGEWFDFWSDARIEGGDSVRLQASLDHIPLLARAGSLLPLEVNGRLQLHLYAPSEGEGEGRLYLDAGDGYGEWRLERYRLRRSDGRLEIERESQGPYAFPYPAVELVIHGFSAGGAWVDGQPAPCENNRLICPSFQQIFIER